MSEENQTLTREELASVAMRVENLLGWEERQSDQILLDAKFVRRLIAAAEREMKGNAISQTMDRIMGQGEAAELEVLRAENKRLSEAMCGSYYEAWQKERAENERLREALKTIAAQTSGIPGSAAKSDCMAAFASVALRPDGQTARGDARPTGAAEQQLRPTTEENLTDGEPTNQGEPKS